MKFKLLASQETLQLRQKVLRPGKPIESCYFENDNTENTQHLGAFFESKLVGIISLFRNEHQLFEVHNQIQLRGMAIEPHSQKKGIGRKLLLEAIELTKTEDLIWCNARISASIFYQKNGFVKASDVFNIENVGAHVVMKYIKK
ncbi:MAG: GNAT family N-acetyltransferase [Psychroflexus halocasei]